MNELAVREIPGIARQPGRGGAVVEAGAHGDDEVGAPARLVRRVRAIAADETQRQRVGHVEAAETVRRSDDGNAKLVRGLGQLRACLRQGHAVADEEHRPLGLQDHFQGRRDLLRRGAAALRAEGRRRRRQFNIVLFLEHVVGNVDIHRARPPRQHRRRRLAQRERQHVDPGRLKAAFDHGPDHVDEIRLIVPVDLLKRAAVELRGRHVGGDGEQRRGVGQCQCQRHDDVRRAGAAGGERRHRLVAHAEIGVRHVTGDLLVARRDQLDPIAGVIKRVEHADVAVAANPEHIGNTASDQVLGDKLGTLHSRHVASCVLVPARRSLMHFCRLAGLRSEESEPRSIANPPCASPRDSRTSAPDRA